MATHPDIIGSIEMPDSNRVFFMWTGAEIAVLRKGLIDGLSYSEIAQLLPRRSSCAVKDKARPIIHELGLPRRAGPKTKTHRTQNASLQVDAGPIGPTYAERVDEQRKKIACQNLLRAMLRYGLANDSHLGLGAQKFYSLARRHGVRA